MKIKNEVDEELNDVNRGTTTRLEPQLGVNGDLFLLRKADEQNRIDIVYAIRSDINVIQPIEFEMVFSQKNNREGFLNYRPKEIVERNEQARSLTTNDLEDFSICLEYEVESLVTFHPI